MQATYKKRENIQGGLTGTIYQIKLMIKFALVHYVDFIEHNKNLKTLKLTTENHDFGDYDDIVIETPDKIIAIQTKHTLEGTGNKTYTLNNFSGDPNCNTLPTQQAALAQYFDSWCKIKDNYPANPLECIFLTPLVLNKDVLPIYNEHSKTFQVEPSLQLEQLQSGVKNYSKSLQRFDPDKVKAFIRQHQIWVGQKHEDELDKELREYCQRQSSIGFADPLLFYTFYDYMIEKLKSLNNSVLDGEALAAVVNKAKQATQEIRLAGYCNYLLNNMVVSVYERAEEKAKINRFLSGTGKILLVYGKAHSGKSTLVAHCLATGVKRGESHYLPVNFNRYPAL